MKDSLMESAFADALKSVARNLEFKTYLQHSREGYPLLLRAAERFITGEVLEKGMECRNALDAKGYRTSLEYIGENNMTEAECKLAFMEFSRLIEACSNHQAATRISLDLSHIGLSVDEDLTYNHLVGLARQAEKGGLEVIISMEESAKMDAILALYRKTASAFPNVGITLPAQLPRTLDDLQEVLATSRGPVRIVKGAYQEKEGTYIPRSEALTARYLQLVDLCIHSGRQVSVATHDEIILEHIIGSEMYRSSSVEVEMLYGIRPDLSKRLKDLGFPIRIYLAYGEEWFLYLCHRIAEYPPNIYDAITRTIQGGNVSRTLY